MVLVTAKSILTKASKGNYAIGAFNVNDLEIMQAVLEACEEEKSPVIIQTTEGAIEYAGIEFLVSMVQTAAKKYKIPIALHLDHGKDMKIIKKCIELGYTSVMIDASSYDFKKNVRLTKKVVELAHKKRVANGVVSVEAEIGVLAGVEDKVSAEKSIYTNPDQAVDFVKATGVDTLAIAIGTSHGAYKFAGAAKLEYKILKEINKRLQIPLVLHGASSVYPELVAKINKYGGKIKGAHGSSDADLKKACRLGINKVNTDTDLRLAFTGAIREFLAGHKDAFDPRKLVGAAKEDIKEVIKRKIKVLGSKGKA